MGLTTIVQTIDDLDVSPGSGYSAAFLHSFEQPGSAATFVETAAGPVVSHVAPGMYRLSALSIFIEEGDESVMQIALLRALDTTRAAKSIVISDRDGGNRRYLMFVAEAINQLPETAGLGYVATLLAHEDIRWRGESDVTETHTFTGSGDWTVTVDGHLTTYPTITVTPRAAKSAPGWQHTMTKVVRWRSPLALHQPVPIEITGGGWNTAALVTAGEMTTRHNIAVLDSYGRFIPHWYGADDGAAGGFNSTTTKLWIVAASLPFTRETPVLAQALAADSTALEVPIDTNDTTALPQAGWLRFADTGEIISYNGVDRNVLQLVRRGVAGTTRADHPSGTALESGIAPYQIVWDPASTVTAAQQTGAYRTMALYEPLIDKAASTNGYWKQTTFRDGSRAGGWGYTGPRSHAYTEATDSGGAAGGFREPWTAMGYHHDIRGLMMFTRTYPMPIDTVRVTGRKFGIGYFPSYPNSARLRAIAAKTRNSLTLWDSSEGGWDEDNGPFDETLLTPTTNRETIPAGETSQQDWYYDNWELFNELSWMVPGTNANQVDIQRVDVTFTSQFTPIIETYTPTTTYDLDMLIFNATTDEALYLFMPGLEIDQSVVISAPDHTVTYSGDNSNKYAACRKVDGESEWLMTMEPGDNVLTVTEAYMSDVDIEVRYTARYYA